MTIDFSNNSPANSGAPKNNGVRAQDLRANGGNASGAVNADAKASSDANNAQAQKVSVSLSDSARAIAQAENNLKQSSDVDYDKVAALKARIESGDYSANVQNLAQKMLDFEV